MRSSRNIKWGLGILLILSALSRAVIAGLIELGNDEVYYWTYAKFPDLSHFDHPSMVGWVIQLFTLNLRIDTEFFIRLGAVVLGTGSTYLIFLIGRQIKDALTGFYAALLYTSSFYCFILCGLFILPDAPQVFFWLLTLYFLTIALPDTSCSQKSRRFIIYAGASIGLALLSKYHSIFLVAGMIIYVLVYNRNWLRTREFYIAFLLSGLIFIPVIFWNMENDFVSFTFHENRVGVSKSGVQPIFFLTELIGQIFYNNPVNVVIILAALIALIRKKEFLDNTQVRLLLWTSLPLVLVIITFSLFRSTLPHWTGPGYLGFILLAAALLSGPLSEKDSSHALIPWPTVISLIVLISTLFIAVGQIRHGWIKLRGFKIEDVTLDMVGQRQLAEKFAPIVNWNEQNYLIDPGSPILTFRWFPAANFDYYIGRSLHKKVYALGELKRIHKYYWINKERGNLKQGSDAWYIALSDDYENPEVLYGSMYEMIIPGDTIVIVRGQDTVRRAFVFRLIDLKQDMVFNPADTIRSGKMDEMDTLLYFMRQIRSDERWLKILQKKADQDSVSIDEIILKEARLLRDSSNQILKRDRSR